jgi:predicted transcriptional regulator
MSVSPVTYEFVTEKTVSDHITKLTADIVTAFVGSIDVQTTDLSGLISSVHRALTDSKANVPETGPASHGQQPAIDPQKSVFKDHLVCLEDGKSFKMLKGHLKSDHDMTPDQYRVKWGLPAHYPMVAEEYAATRSAMAKKNGLGKKAAAMPVRKRRR